MQLEEMKKMIREIVQALLALMFAGAVIYLTIILIMPPEILASLAGATVAYFAAERKNGEDRQHREKLEQMYVDAAQTRAATNVVTPKS